MFILLYVKAYNIQLCNKHLYDFKKYEYTIKPYNVRLYGYVNFIASLNKIHVMAYLLYLNQYIRLTSYYSSSVISETLHTSRECINVPHSIL